MLDANSASPIDFPKQGKLQLFRFSRSAYNEDRVKQLLALTSIQALAGDSAFFLRGLPDGKRALCCGEFADETSAEAVLRRFQEYTTYNATGFPKASVQSLSD